MAFASFDLSHTSSRLRYPASGAIAGQPVTLRLMNAGDNEAILALAQSLPQHDLLFLRRDITQPDQIDVWIERLDAGSMASLLLVDDDDTICGYASVDRSDTPWSPHVAYLRVLVAPDWRGRGVGRLLTEEAFRIALEMNVSKIIAEMTVDQRQALAVFRSLGFHPEAILRDHVQDREGEKHDLVILSHDVKASQQARAAVGMADAVSG